MVQSNFSILYPSISNKMSLKKLSILISVIFQQHVWKPPGRCSRSCYQFSLPATSLSRHMAACTVLVCKVQCYMPVRLGHWKSQTSNVYSGMTGQWSDRSAMSSRKTLSPSGPMSYLCSLALRIWTASWMTEGSLEHFNCAVFCLCWGFTAQSTQCRARSAYVITRLLGRLSPLSC